jgi:hypothetical protein
MARMKAKYPGTCRTCGDQFNSGADIIYTKSAPKGRKTVHSACAGVSSDFYADEASAARGVSYEVRTSGGTFYQNRNGLCEDAPCCGCCTF